MEPIGVALRPSYMDTSRVVVRPAPQFEHPGSWAGACECASTGAVRGMPVRPLLAVPDPAPVAGADAAAASARTCAIAAMTVVLEVIDRRRPVSSLRGLVAGTVVDHVMSRGNARHESRTTRGRVESSSLRLRRVHIQLVDDEMAEFFGSYTCGDRVRAFAGRMAVATKARSARARPAWQMQRLMLD